MRSPREALRELDLLVLQADASTTSIGHFLRAHLDSTGKALGLTEHEVLALSTLLDEPLVFYLGPALRQHHLWQKETQMARKVEQTSRAISQLAMTVRWHGERAQLDARRLLGSLRAVTQKTVLFSSSVFAVSIAKSKLRELAKAVGHRDDLAAFVDQRGLHVHWRQGKGRLLLFGQSRRQHEQDVLTVSLRGDSDQRTLSTAAE